MKTYMLNGISEQHSDDIVFNILLDLLYDQYYPLQAKTIGFNFKFSQGAITLRNLNNQDV